MTIRAVFFFVASCFIGYASAESKPVLSLNEQRFTITIDFKKSPKKYTLSCNLTDPCQLNDYIKVMGYPQLLRIVVDIASTRRGEAKTFPQAPTGYRYNITLDTGDEGDFLNTAHLAKRGTMPPYQGTSFKAPLTYWYKHKGREVKKTLDIVQVTLTAH